MENGRTFIAGYLILGCLAGCHERSPYAGQDEREIKALSQQETADLLAGRGMGLAKAAELNGYPGPLHVLQLADELELTANQRERTQAVFDAMQSQAVALGRELVEAERALDARFASRTIDSVSLAETLAQIGNLEARLREVHLKAHLTQTELLTAEQVAKYVELRGYADGSHSEHTGHGR